MEAKARLQLMEKATAALRWLYTPAHALPICLAAGFLLPSNAAWSSFFYIVGWPTALLGIWRGWRPDWSNLPVMALLAFWGWSSLAILWESVAHGDGHVYWLLSSASTLSLLLCFFMAVQAEPGIKERIETVIIWCAAAAVTLSICLHISDHQWNGWDGQPDGWWGGWGTLHLPVLGAAVVVVCILLALGRVVEGRLWYLVALAPLLIYMPLNGSRTALVGLVCTLLVVATNNRKLFYGFILSGLMILVLYRIFYALHFSWVYGFIKTAMARGTDCHITIWRTAWEMFLKHPVLGYGPSLRLSMSPLDACPIHPAGPHNIYLSLLIYSGLIGFILFWLCEITVLRRLLNLSTGIQRRLGMALMLVPLITGLTDLNHIIKGPSPLWYIIWLPLLLVVSLPGSAPESHGKS